MLWVRYSVKKDYLLLFFILLLATFLRLNGLNEPGLWLDEVSYTTAAQRPILNQIINPTETLGNYLSVDPTLSAIPFSLSLKLGFSNFLVRFPAALFGILTIATAYRVGRALFGNYVGFVTALLLSSSSFHVLYSQEARSYTQFIFFSMISFLFLYQATIHNKLHQWGLYTLCTWVGVSTNHLMIFVIAAQGLFLFTVCLRGAFLHYSSYADVIRTSVKVLSSFSISLLIIFILRVPWLEDFTKRQCAGCDIGHPSYPLDIADSVIRSLQAFAGPMPTIAVFIVILSLGLILVFRYSFERGLLLASWLILSILLTTLGLWFISQFFHERYTIWGLPAFFLAASCGLVGISDSIGRLWLFYQRKFTSKSPGRIVTFATVSLLLIPLLLANFNQIRQNPIIKQSWPRGKLQEVTDKIANEATSNETIIAIGMPAWHLQFYLDHTRQDLIYLDETIFAERANVHSLPKQLTGRWYVLHNSYTAPHIPVTWVNSLDYTEFNDIVLVHSPKACELDACLYETKKLLSEISAINPGSRLAERVNGILLGLTYLP